MDHHPGHQVHVLDGAAEHVRPDRKSTRLNSSHSQISYAVFCLKKKNFCLSSLSPSSTNASPRTASSGLWDAAFASVAASLKLFLAKALWAISRATRPLSARSG